MSSDVLDPVDLSAVAHVLLDFEDVVEVKLLK